MQKQDTQCLNSGPKCILSLLYKKHIKGVPILQYNYAFFKAMYCLEKLYCIFLMLYIDLTILPPYKKNHTIKYLMPIFGL